MKVLLSSGCLFRAPLEKTYYLAASCGFDGVELILNDIYYQKDIVERIAELSKISPTLALHAPFSVDSSKEKIGSLLKSVEIAESLGIEIVVFHPPLKKFLDRSFSRWFWKTDFRKYNSVCLCLEIMPFSFLGPFRVNFFSPAGLEDLKEVAIGKGLGIAFDTTHCGTAELDLVEGFELLGGVENVFHIHLSDLKKTGRRYVEHVFPGEGELDLWGFVVHVVKAGYSGAITLEVSPDQLPQDDLEKARKLSSFLERIRSLR